MFPANVTVRLSSDGSVLVRCGFHEMGMGSATAVGQVAAHALGVPFDAVQVEYGDSDLPVGPPAGGSTQTASVASSILEAATKLKRDLHKLAGRAGVAPTEPPATILARRAATISSRRSARTPGSAR